jgi:4-hydroxybenzoate polyprenyltransferase
MEDMEGDAAEGCVTMPIRHGLAFAGRFASVLALFAIIPLVLSAYFLLLHGYTVLAIYVLVLLAAPLAGWIWHLWQGAADPKHYHRSSSILKIIMVLGICSLLIYKFQ